MAIFRYCQFKYLIILLDGYWFKNCCNIVTNKILLVIILLSVNIEINGQSSVKKPTIISKNNRIYTKKTSDNIDAFISNKILKLIKDKSICDSASLNNFLFFILNFERLKELASTQDIFDSICVTTSSFYKYDYEVLYIKNEANESSWILNTVSYAKYHKNWNDEKILNLLQKVGDFYEYLDITNNYEYTDALKEETLLIFKNVFGSKSIAYASSLIGKFPDIIKDTDWFNKDIGGNISTRTIESLLYSKHNAKKNELPDLKPDNDLFRLIFNKKIQYLIESISIIRKYHPSQKKLNIYLESILKISAIQEYLNLYNEAAANYFEYLQFSNNIEDKHKVRNSILNLFTFKLKSTEIPDTIYYEWVKFERQQLLDLSLNKDKDLIGADFILELNKKLESSEISLLKKETNDYLFFIRQFKELLNSFEINNKKTSFFIKNLKGKKFFYELAQYYENKKDYKSSLENYKEIINFSNLQSYKKLADEIAIFEYNYNDSDVKAEMIWCLGCDSFGIYLDWIEDYYKAGKNYLALGDKYKADTCFQYSKLLIFNFLKIVSYEGRSNPKALEDNVRTSGDFFYRKLDFDLFTVFDYLLDIHSITKQNSLNEYITLLFDKSNSNKGKKEKDRNRKLDGEDEINVIFNNLKNEYNILNQDSLMTSSLDNQLQILRRSIWLLDDITNSYKGLNSIFCKNDSRIFNNTVSKSALLTLLRVKPISLKRDIDINNLKFSKNEELILLKNLLLNVKNYLNQGDYIESQFIKTFNSISIFLESEMFKNINIKNKLLNSIYISEFDKNLKHGSAAIEYFTYNCQGSDTYVYIAAVIRPEWDTPRFIKLFEEKKMIDLLNKHQLGKNYFDLYNQSLNKRDSLTRRSNPFVFSNELYKVLWQPLDSLLNGVNEIFMASTGLLSNISFGAIPITKDSILSDRYKIHNYFSISDIIGSNDSTSFFRPEHTGLLIGGVNYSHNSNVNILKKIPFLPGTKKEVELISKMFTSKVLIDTMATELNIKNLSGNAPSILHIATHGFYFTNTKNKETLVFEQGTEYRLKDDSFFRTGLLMAGSQKSWQGDTIPPDQEDGVITAYELSNIDLTQTKLVVLSACNTGLGDIKGSEGTFGLQRALKMAGVKYILTSLWNIPDKQTSELMTLFYENWIIKKMSIRDAITNAQSILRFKYKDPKLWAGFVLLE